MPTNGRYQTYLSNIYRFSSGVQISVTASNVHIQYINIQFYSPLWLPLPTKPFAFKYMNSFVISRHKKIQENLLKIHFQVPGSRVSGPTFRVPGLGFHLSDRVCLSDKIIRLLHFTVSLKFEECYILGQWGEFRRKYYF